MNLRKSVTVKDVADELNVSLATVSRALTGKPGVGEEKRLEIQNIAREMGYTVNGVAQIMSRKVFNIGVIMPSFANEYYSRTRSGMNIEFLKLTEYKVNSEFYYITAAFSENDTAHIKKWIERQKLNAIIFAPTLQVINELIISAVHQTQVPLFMAGGGIDPKNSVTTVTEDARHAGKMAADFFECIYGPKILAAVFTSCSDDLLNNVKVETFKQRVQQAGGTVCAVLEAHNAPEVAYARIRTIFQEYPKINCIYVNNSNSKEICEFIEENDLQNKVTLLGTDRYDEQDEYIKSGVMKATIFQNQDRLGETVVKSAYEYLVKSSSYGNEDWKPEELILVCPHLHLKSNVI